MAYFSSFPKIFYDVRGLQSRSPEDIVTNIMARVLLKASAFDNPDTSQQDLLQATGYFQKHIIQDGERLDTLAYEYMVIHNYIGLLHMQMEFQYQILIMIFL